MIKRKLFPPELFDRIALSMSLFFCLLAYVIVILFPAVRTALGWFLLIWVHIWFLITWAIVYFFQKPPKDEFENYTASIAKIEGIGKQLSELLVFLKLEREKVAESEATLARLRDEQAKLEPVVLAQRDTVTAILEAHARSTASRAWKERALGFTSGLFASLIAAMVFEYFRR